MTDKLLTHNCIMCGEEFRPVSSEVTICQQCGRQQEVVATAEETPK